MLIAPLVGAGLQIFVPNEAAGLRFSPSRWTALIFSGLSSVLGVVAVASMTAGVSGPQLVENLDWITSYAINYEVGLDGLNALGLLLISVVFPVLIASEWARKDAVRGVHGLFLMLQFALAGTVIAQDLFLLFFFWALVSLPFFFLLGYFGGKGREEAAFQGIVAAAVGNALFLGALVLIYNAAETPTFLLRELSGGKLEDKVFQLLGREFSVASTAFSLVALGVAIRMPIWPLNGWLTRAAEEAPLSVLTSLAALIPPVGGYVFFRIGYSLFPQTFQSASTIIVTAGVISLAMGAFCAAHQRGLRLLIANLSTMGSGLAMIGMGSLSSAGIVGALFQQMAMGFALAALGLLAGIMQESTGEVYFVDENGKPTQGGIALRAPLAALVAGIVMASYLGFPGMSGFVGNSLLVIGSYPAYPIAVVLVAAMLLVAAYSLFSMYRYIFLGKTTAKTADYPELTLRERAYLLPVVCSVVAFGLYPKPLIELVRPTVVGLLSVLK